MSHIVSLGDYKKKEKTNIVIESIPWVEKYRPKTIDSIILHPYIRTKVDRIIQSKNIPNLIMTGEPGTGKTTTIFCITKNIYSRKEQAEVVLELNASDDRGLSIINNTIIPFCRKKVIGVNHKLVILDEADSITNKAQNLLNTVIAEYIHNTRFVFICNECHKITEPIQSRCNIIRFPRIEKENIYKRIEEICKLEKIKYNEQGINTLIFVSNSDIRQSINNLECIYNFNKNLIDNNIYNLIDQPKPIYIENIFKQCLQGNLKLALQSTKELEIKGYSLNDILLNMMKCLLENEFTIKEEIKLKLFELLSLTYIKVNEGSQSYLQIYGCLSRIYLHSID